MIKRVLLTILIALCLALPAVPVSATDLPDTTPEIVYFRGWRNVLETGDFFLAIYANVPYSTLPDDPIWQTFTWRAFDPTATDEYGAALSYAHNDLGYGYNLTTMYWDADNVTALGMTWGDNKVIKLNGNPAAFASPPEYIYTVSTADYSTVTDSEDVEAEMTVWLLMIAADLDARWGLGVTYSLLQEIETGTVLSLYGQAFFRGAIYGVQGMCPDLFPYSITDMEMTTRTFGTSYNTTLTNQWAGTWIETARNAGSALFGTGFDLSMTLMVVGLCALAVIISVAVGSEPWGGLLDGYIVMLGLTRLGFFELGILGMLAAILFTYGSVRLWNVLRG